MPAGPALRRHSELRRRKSRALIFQLVLLVILPTFLSAVYYGLIATPRYVSEARAKIEKAQGNIATAGILESAMPLLGGGGGASHISIVREYIRSPQILSELQAVLDLRKIYSSDRIDWLSRLPRDATDDEFLDYYRDRLHVSVDQQSGVLTLQVESFTAEDAQATATAILTLSDQLLNDLSIQARDDALAFARRELKTAEARLARARLAMTRYRNRSGQLDPTRSAEALGGIVAGLEAQLATARTELTQLQQFMRPDSIQIVAKKNQIDALEKQIAAESLRLTKRGGTAKDRPLSNTLEEYSVLKIEEEFATQAYTAAAASLELSRAEALRKTLYLVPFIKPTLADVTTEPDIPRSVGTVFVIALLAFGIFKLLTAAIREHLHT